MTTTTAPSDSTYNYSCMILPILRNRRGRDHMVVGFTTICAVFITTKVVSSNPIHGHSMQRYGLTNYGFDQFSRWTHVINN
jgi:hypothetical protein